MVWCLYVNLALLTASSEQSVSLDSSLSSLDASLRAFFNEYRQGSADATELMKKHVAIEISRSGEAVMSHVTQTAMQSEQSTKKNIGAAFEGVIKQSQGAHHDAKRDRLLRSLKFDRMNERRSLVGPSHPKTFEWILRDGSEVNEPQASDDVSDGVSEERASDDDDDESDDEFDYTSESESDEELSCATNSWDSFSDWLRSTERVYWISGNPGSGKTTLVKYILNQPQLRRYLDLWAPGAVIISHFFWRPGTAMQQSIRGLLCSTLYQLLLEENVAIDQLLQSHDDKSNKDTDTDWSTEELQSALQQVMSHYSRPIVIFIDGLDEVLPKDGVLRLLEVVEKLKELQGPAGKVKICLGSRREPLLCKRLGVYPQLRLEQLNHTDLRRYGKDNIIVPTEYHIRMSNTFMQNHERYCFIQERLPSRDELREWLVATLVNKAQGVFLWLCLTVTTVTKALNDDETMEDLETRIESLPGDLADLYADMWARMNYNDSRLKVRAASYLQLALADNQNRSANYPLNPFIMMVATTPGMADRLLQSDPSNHVSVTTLIEACEMTMRETASRCAGLIACPAKERAKWNEGQSPWQISEYTSLVPYASEYPAYSFLHRTAQDFLTDTDTGHMVLSSGSFTGERARLHLFKARLTIHRLFKKPLYSWYGSRCGPAYHSNGVGSLLFGLWRPLRFRTTAQRSDVESTRTELSRLLLICEQLFNYGYLYGTPEGYHRILLPESTVVHVYGETTVHHRHEFLVEASMWSYNMPNIWACLLPIVKSRNIDCNTMSQLLVHACSLERSIWDNRELEFRIKAIEVLLSRGASPRHETLRRRPPLGYRTGATIIKTLETPFRALIMSIWSIASKKRIDSIQSQKLLDVIALFVALGADLQDEVYIAIEVTGDLVVFRDLWDDPYGSQRDVRASDCSSRSIDLQRMLIVLGCPASTVINRILDNWQLEIPPQTGWLPGLRETAPLSFDQGQLIAVVDLSLSRQHVYGYIPLTLFIADVFALGKGKKVEEDFLPLVHLAENGLESAFRTSVLKHTRVPSELQERAWNALEQIRSENVPVGERIKEVRMRLGVCTPLEEPEWQL